MKKANEVLTAGGLQTADRVVLYDRTWQVQAYRIDGLVELVDLQTADAILVRPDVEVARYRHAGEPCPGVSAAVKTLEPGTIDNPGAYAEALASGRAEELLPEFKNVRFTSFEPSDAGVAVGWEGVLDADTWRGQAYKVLRGIRDTLVEHGFGNQTGDSDEAELGLLDVADAVADAVGRAISYGQIEHASRIRAEGKANERDTRLTFKEEKKLRSRLEAARMALKAMTAERDRLRGTRSETTGEAQFHKRAAEVSAQQLRSVEQALRDRLLISQREVEVHRKNAAVHKRAADEYRSLVDSLPDPTGATARVLREVAAERMGQDRQWGGPSHDDEHGPRDWLAFITEHAGIAGRSVNREDAKEYRHRLIHVAAIAVAAVESHDRTQPGAANGPT